MVLKIHSNITTLSVRVSAQVAAKVHSNITCPERTHMLTKGIECIVSAHTIKHMVMFMVNLNMPRHGQ